MRPSTAQWLSRSLLLSPDLVCKAAARRAPTEEAAWMLRQPRSVRESYVREVLQDSSIDLKAQQAWMLRQPKEVRESYIREVLGRD